MLKLVKLKKCENCLKNPYYLWLKSLENWKKVNIFLCYECDLLMFYYFKYNFDLKKDFSSKKVLTLF